MPLPTHRRPAAGPRYLPIVDLDSGSVVAIETVAAPPPTARGGFAAVTEQECEAVAEWLLTLVRDSAGTESLLPLVLPLPARTLSGGDAFIAAVESRMRRAGRRPRDVTFMLSPDLAELDRQTVVAGVARLRAAGFRCGFGTAMVRPDLMIDATPFLVRIDPQIVSGLATDQRHVTVVEGLARIGRGSGVFAMASGVSSAEEVVRLRRCGLRVATGPFFADEAWRPGERVAPVPEPATEGPGTGQDSGPPVTEYMVPPVGLDADSTADQVLTAFTDDPALNSVILIDHRDRPLGVIDRTRFLLLVTGRYGHALHAKRPALRMAEAPRTVPAWMSAIAALRVAGQDNERVYDDLIVTNDYAQVFGVVHVSDLVRSLSLS
ncbi:EAL domain-containing protein [Nocardiopsis aegyptia]|uniref:EAL domain-containing protein (Putative c-di-GMP-specific phosphodiesterase class I) n=1 Tax=Nocardiopsis aegyptia TaxID=220378 RepID=A0A7Z0EU82_9ACTN|nr:EAL domain-containing protein [Nocardiopsis aegyptia]NYJ37420.1 EAL domain-containing protein (putative c-di-GMP-specific phosphodiesterase class I) [Nocardiopsis aegyptia]